MSPENNPRLDEYTALISSISQVQAELAGEQETQQQLRQQIEECHRKLKQAFAEHWQTLRIKQV